MSRCSAELGRIIDAVREAGQDGLTAGEAAEAAGVSLDAAQAALTLQVQAGLMESFPDFVGERYRGECYRLKGRGE